MTLVFRPENLAHKGQPYEHVIGMDDRTVLNSCAVVEFDYTAGLRTEARPGDQLPNDLILEPGFDGFSDQDMILMYVHTGGGSAAATTQMYRNGYSAGEGPLPGYSTSTTGNADTAALCLTGDRDVVLG